MFKISDKIDLPPSLRELVHLSRLSKSALAGWRGGEDPGHSSPESSSVIFSQLPITSAPTEAFIDSRILRFSSAFNSVLIALVHLPIVKFVIHWPRFY